ncbi:MAG: tetratricopeptide repeat protein [Polyangiaceae bacterium]
MSTPRGSPAHASASRWSGDRPGRAAKGESPIALRLAIGREGIGIELVDPAWLGCVLVSELTASLPGLRFPIDVSGGMMRFRHRRGALQALRVEVVARTLARYAAPKLRGLVAATVPDVWIEVGPSRATVCVGALGEPEDEPAPGRTQAPSPALAFDVNAIAEGRDLLLAIDHARGVSLSAPPTALAMACVETVLGSVAVRSGAIFTLKQPAERLARVVFPSAGARAPSAEGVSWGALSTDGDTWIGSATRDATPAAPSEDAVRARELARLVLDGDEALSRADLTAARAAYIDAIERAPRHAEIARRIADVDQHVGQRAESALATLAQATARDGRSHKASIAHGELLAQVGDHDAAIAMFERAGDTEPAPLLAARAFELAARSTRDPQDAARWLDRALVRAPRTASARWARIEARLSLGRLEDALADVEALEAIAQGSRSKQAVWMRAGRAWRSAGLSDHAGAVFRRALRYTPDQPGALAGLGLALLGDSRKGQVSRGVALLSRALDVAEARGEPAWSIVLDLSRALAERLGDLPAAIARISAIPADAPEAPVARGLEGRWRGSLGDVAGAGLAFARLRDIAASFAPLASESTIHATVDLLREAADFERSVRHDSLAAQRHLAVALRLCPDDAGSLRAYREVGATLLRDADAGAPPMVRPSEGPSPLAQMLMEVDDRDAPADAERSARVEDLTRRLQSDPADDAVAGELATLLEELDRGHELVALLSARIEDAAAGRRIDLATKARGSLERMIARAEASGSPDRATLYRDALVALSAIEG